MPNIVHFEIPVEDIQRAKRFYANLFGWKIESMPGTDYMIIDPYSVPGGGMMKRTQPEQQIMVNIGVSLMDEYAAKIEKLGGKIIVPKEVVPGRGYFAICKDTENNTFGIWEANPQRSKTWGFGPISGRSQYDLVGHGSDLFPSIATF